MDARDYPEAYLIEDELDDYGTRNHVIDKAAKEIKQLRQRVAELEMERNYFSAAAGELEHAVVLITAERDEWEANSGQWEQEYYKVSKERDELLAELEHCAGVFRRYEQIHLLKCTDDGNDKAHGNGVLAARCEAAIASVKEKS